MDELLDDPLTRLAIGYAMLLDSLGIGTWSTTSLYTDDQVAITLDETSPAPDNAIALTPYSVSNDPALSDSVLGLQVVTRGRARALASQVLDQLHGAHDFRLPVPESLDPSDGIWVVQCLHRSGVGGGRDENGRLKYIQNFYATVHLPSTHRT